MHTHDTLGGIRVADGNGVPRWIDEGFRELREDRDEDRRDLREWRIEHHKEHEEMWSVLDKLKLWQARIGVIQILALVLLNGAMTLVVSLLVKRMP